MSRIPMLKVEGRRLQVFVGMSGGVDSSVSAALLKKQGYEVTGVFIKVWQPDFFDCGWKDDRLDAMRVCAKLQIPFRELDLEKAYKKEVVDYMIREYKAGKTPNPDVMCNRFIKFGKFYDWATRNGADFIATGHYARIAKTQSIEPKTQKHRTQRHRLLTTHYSLLAGVDSTKDQSYFLWQIRREQLPRILFPVGGMRKTEVRKLANKFDLITAEKKDSQGLCFIGKVDMKDFLKHFIKEKPGEILDRDGKVIGRHQGSFFYTLGQRISVFSSASPAQVSARAKARSGGSPFLEGSGGLRKVAQPYYVIAKDMRKNTVIVSPKNPSGNLDGTAAEVEIKNCNWFSAPKKGKTYAARTRYREELRKARVAVSGGRTIVRFEAPLIAAPGQSLVLYDGEMVAGGGIIC